MAKRRFTSEAYTETARSVKTEGHGETSYAGIQLQKEGKGLDPLVDPKGFDLVRFSRPRYDLQDNGTLLLPNGIPMLSETRFDTTGSMGRNVRVAFEVLPITYGLLTGGVRAVLGRYDTQIINAIFGDIQDNYVLYRSQAEMDVEIARQLTLMVPECEGGDTTEDPDYGIFGGAYLTNAFINKYGLKYYDFTVTDAPCRKRIDRKNLIRVFGETVFEKVKENGHHISEEQLPTTKEMVTELQKHAHAFVLSVCYSYADHWARLYGTDHVVVIPHTGYLPYVQAAIIGLTEGVLDLQTVEEYLRDAGCEAYDAKMITRALVRIPVGAQTLLPNFHKIPLAGTYFAKKGDLWPIGTKENTIIVPPKKSGVGTPSAESEVPDDEDDWL